MDNIYSVIFLRDGMENIKYYENLINKEDFILMKTNHDNITNIILHYNKFYKRLE